MRGPMRADAGFMKPFDLIYDRNGMYHFNGILFQDEIVSFQDDGGRSLGDRDVRQQLGQWVTVGGGRPTSEARRFGSGRDLVVGRAPQPLGHRARRQSNLPHHRHLQQVSGVIGCRCSTI